MSRILIVLLFFIGAIPSFSQNQIRVKGGVTSSKTSISEYERGIGYFYYDSVTLDTRVTYPAVNIEVDIDLNNNFYLTNGLSYMRKGVPQVFYNNGGYWLEARQEYIGMNTMLKYHHKFADKGWGLYAAAGFRADFTVGGPNNAEIAFGEGSEFFQAFGTFSTVEFVLPTTIGASYHLGPGDIIVEVNFLKGLSDVIPDQYIVGRTFTYGASLGYSVYLQ